MCGKFPEEEVICVMSGDFVQRGEAALYHKVARAEAACRCGAENRIRCPQYSHTALTPCLSGCMTPPHLGQLKSMISNRDHLTRKISSTATVAQQTTAVLNRSKPNQATAMPTTSAAMPE